MKIRSTQLADIEIVMNIYNQARQFMRKTGNNSQWINGYPCQELVLRDILSGDSYVCTKDDDEIIGVFYFSQINDITYSKINDGNWLNDRPYCVIHRLAGIEKVSGIADFCLKWCFDRFANIRIDTHRDNLIMQKILLRNGYIQCGVITVEDGTEKLAFHKH